MPPFPEHLRHEQPLGLGEAEQLALSVLCLEDRRFLVEARYLVIRLLVVYRGQVADEKVSTLTRKLGMSEAVLRKARKQLADIDGLAPSLNTSRQRGRPPLELKISLSLLARLQDAQKTPLFKQSQQEDRALQYDTEIRDFLLWVGEQDPLKKDIKTKKVKAPPGESTKPCLFLCAPRVLLAIFYLHASPFGEVHLGKGRLQRLTGMSMDRLDNQLENLTKLGFFDPDCPVFAGNTYGKKSAKFESIFYLRMHDPEKVLLSFSKNKRIINHYNEYDLSIRLVIERYSSLTSEEPLRHFGQNASIKDKVDLHKVLGYYRSNFSKFFDAFKEKCFGMFLDSRFKEVEEPLNLFDDPHANIYRWSNCFDSFGLYLFVKPPFGKKWNPHLNKRFNDFSMDILSKGLKKYSASRVVVHEEVLQGIESDLAPFYVPPIQVDDPSQQAIASDLQSFVIKVFSFYAYCLAYQKAGAIGALMKEILINRRGFLSKFSDDDFYLKMLPSTRQGNANLLKIDFRLFLRDGSRLAICYQNFKKG